MRAAPGVRLSAEDASLVVHEDLGDEVTAECGFLYEFAGTTVDLDLLRATVQSRLGRFRPLCATLCKPPWGLGRHVWLDSDVDVARHVVGLTASPGTSLMAVVSEIVDVPFARQMPLWSMTVIDGYQDGCFAVLWKGHHALHDARSFAHVVHCLIDDEETGRSVPPAVGRPPTATTWLRWYGRDLLAAARVGAVGLWRGVRRPRAALRATGRVLSGLAFAAPVLLRPTSVVRVPDTASVRRRLPGTAWRTRPKADYDQARRPYGATINDLYLSCLAQAISRCTEPTARTVRVFIPVDRRRADEADAIGNRLTATWAPLPHVEGNRLALPEIKCFTARTKRRHLSAGLDAFNRLDTVLPLWLLRSSSRLHFSTRLFGAVVSCLKITRVPTVQGRRCLRVGGVNFLPKGHEVTAVLTGHGSDLTLTVVARAEQVWLEELMSAYDEALDAAVGADLPKRVAAI